MNFSSFVGQDQAKRALILNAVDHRCGGVLLVGEKGSGKSTLARTFSSLLPAGSPFVELPLNVTQDALLGGVDLEETLRTGRRVFRQGILSRVNGGVLFVDDLNLLSAEIASNLFEVQDRRENVVAREGLSLRHPASFILVATMCPDEGGLSEHLLDRFGMCCWLKRIEEAVARVAIIKSACGDDAAQDDGRLSQAILGARQLLPHVSIGERLLEYIADICMSGNVAGHRADICLLAAARAQAAFTGKKEVSRAEIDLVAPLVLMHRQREFRPPPPPPPQEQDASPPESDRRQPPPDQPEDQPERSVPNENNPEKNNQRATPRKMPAVNEEVFPVGQPFALKRLLFRKDRRERAASGRRTRTRSRNRGGRYVKSMIRPNRDIAIDATLRAAAPFQRGRGRNNLVVIEKEDFRYKLRERKMGHLVLFVVDGSGSMGAQKRMVAAKGAIQSLLMDCYQKRDQVAMIVFRKDQAEIILQPTASIEHAARRLRTLPVGGKTPLGAGLMETCRLLELVGRKRPEARFLVVLITDGRANQAISSLSPEEEIAGISSRLRNRPAVDIIVIDTEEKGRFTTTDGAAAIAAALAADYYTIADLKSETLTHLVLSQKAKD